jgi:hypothetical protein
MCKVNKINGGEGVGGEVEKSLKYILIIFYFLK